MGLRLDTARDAFTAGIAAGPALFVTLALARLLLDALPGESLAPGLVPVPPVAAAAPAGLPLLALPVDGIASTHLRDSFGDDRGGRPHAAIDILAPRSTPVRAAADGTIARLSSRARGGLSIYQRDAAGQYCFFYAHLERYTAGLHEGLAVRQGDPIAAVGSSGNAPESAPHLHFAVLRLERGEDCARGTPVNPLPLLREARPAETR